MHFTGIDYWPVFTTFIGTGIGCETSLVSLGSGKVVAESHSSLQGFVSNFMPASDSRVDLLIAEVQVLQLRVVELQERISALELRGEGYEVVEESPSESVLPASHFPPSGSLRFNPVTRVSPNRTPSRASSPNLPIASSSSVPPLPQPAAVPTERALVLQSIGKWIRLCLQGKRRGTSGREHIAESSHIYLIARAASGECFNPVKICWSWPEARQLVKVGSGFGESVFVGLPSAADIEVVGVWAGLDTPVNHGQ